MKSKLFSLALAILVLASCIFTAFPGRVLAAEYAEAYSFTADNTGIEVGTSDEVTFTAELDASGIGGLYVTDENGQRIAALSEVSPCFYQATVSLSADTRADHTYTLNTKNADAYSCEMHFYNPITDADRAKDAVTVSRVTYLSAGLTAENRSSVLNEMYNELSHDENVSYVTFENDNTITYRTQDGIMHFYDADYTLKRRTFNLDGVAEENAKPYVEEETETRGTVGNKNIYVVCPDYGLDPDFSLQKLYEARNTIANVGGGTISAYYGNGNVGEPEVIGKGDVGAFKKLSGFGTVIIDSHGVQVNSSSALVCTYTSGASSADYSAHRLYEGEDELGKFVAVMDTFITYYNSSLPHSLVYIGSCFGVWASNLRNGFSSLGAGLVCGYDWSVSFFWEQRVFGLFMKTLYTQNSDGSMNTAQQAYNKVKEIFGDTDSVGEKRAHYKLYGDTGLTLMSSGQVSPTPTPGGNDDITVTLTPEKLTLNIGDTQKLNLTIQPESAAASCEIEWSSFNEEIATVTNTGLVRALDEGKTRIAVEVMTPSNQQISRSIELTVVAGGYTVTFVDSLTGKTIDEQIVPEGESANEPTPPKHDGYVFIGWDADFDEVTEDMTVNALYALPGDANLDGKINTADATVVLKYAAQMIQLSSKQQKAADMNTDSKVNTADATAVLRWCAAN